MPNHHLSFLAIATLASLAAAQRPTIMLTGYWPPTNEGVRRFSQNATQNPQGWIGSNWENRGYDVVSFFPEFPGGQLGRGVGDFEVDYQDTSADWWRITGQVKPIAVVTFSRGFTDNSWEIEMNQYNRAAWIGDYLAPLQPTPAPPDNGVPAGFRRLSALPTTAIRDAVNAANLGVTAAICFSGDGGGFLSEFIAYHGVWYQALHTLPVDPDWCIAGGHVHVGGLLTPTQVFEAAKITVRQVIAHVDTQRARFVCQQDLGNAGDGAGQLRMCGLPLSLVGAADALAYDLPPRAPLFWTLSDSQRGTPLPFAGGGFLPGDPLAWMLVTADPQGRSLIRGVRGGFGPFSLFAQCAWLEPALPTGFGLTNALRIDFLP
ncbi:MAG: hypothetical protein IPK26_31525 [Planctomycetes bacterium]|nr:hypothetical protein [Planctomycetota bacterium]